jgi:hypothetical protein
MADFFTRIFAIPSDDDDESYSASDTYSQSSIPRRTASPRKPSRLSTPNSEDEIDESSASEDRKKRGRQRRNDEPSGYRHEPQREKKKRSSSERPGVSTVKQQPSQQSRYRKARSLSKVSERERPTPMSDDNNDAYSLGETQSKMKSWRSKFSAGMKKHLSPTSTSSPPPLHSKHAKKPSRERERVQQPPQPINVGDFITLSQHYLEENADMSVLTLPRELANKEVDEENLMQIVGQRGVLGNNAVQAFLGRVGGSSSVQGDYEELQIRPSTSAESRGVYERVSSYATKLLDISYSQSLENSGTPCEEGVEVDEGDLLTIANRQVGKHAWPCDPTAEGYSPSGDGTATNSIVTEQEIGSLGLPPPFSPSSSIGGSVVKLRVEIPDDSSGIRAPSPSGDKQVQSAEKRRPFDEPSSGPGDEDDIDKPSFRSNKSVSFCLPPPSSQPPAPPYLGPTLDYYYSMERQPKDPLPIWSNSSLLPPIIELWSSVDDGASGQVGSVWDKEKEYELVGEEDPFAVSEEWVQLHEKQPGDQTRTNFEQKQPLISPTSPGEKSIEYFNNILDCNGGEAPMDENEGLIPNGSSVSIKTDPNEAENPGEDANFRHRSQWKSSHNMTYKPPMFNNGGTTFQKETSLIMGRSESSEDSVLQLRRFHGDDVPSPKKQQPQDARPVILHGRVVRHANVVSSNTILKAYSLARSPSTSSYGSTSSHNAKIFAAISIQAAARGMLERQRFMVMINSVLVIQPAVRRFLCRHRYLVQLKLKRSYFRSNWKRRVLNDGRL